MTPPRRDRPIQPLFSRAYLDGRFRDTDIWTAVDADDVRETFETLRARLTRERDRVAERSAPRLEATFVRPVFDALGLSIGFDTPANRDWREPDFGIFESDDAARAAFADGSGATVGAERDGESETSSRTGTDAPFDDALGIANAYRWDRPLDSLGDRAGEFEHPSYRIHAHLQTTSARWGVVTNGRTWRLYTDRTSQRLDSIHQVDLPALLEAGDVDGFTEFCLLFGSRAFRPDGNGNCLLDAVYEGSERLAEETRDDLAATLREAIPILADGFLRHPETDLDPETLRAKSLLDPSRDDVDRARLDLLQTGSIAYLQRLLFTHYAGRTGRGPTDGILGANRHEALANPVYGRHESATSESRPDSNAAGAPDLWSRVEAVIESTLGPESTFPDETVARFLAEFRATDDSLARVLDLLAPREPEPDGSAPDEPMAALDARDFGRLYERLLTEELRVADEPLTAVDGRYEPAGEDDDADVEPGATYLATDAGGRKSTGSFYTPEHLVDSLVEATLDPLLADRRDDVAHADAFGANPDDADAFATRVLDLDVLDPAMGCGHFLHAVTDYLARHLVDARERQARHCGVDSVTDDRGVDWARAQVARRCLYGVDLDPLATAVTRTSVWLRALPPDVPRAVLDSHLGVGNALVGCEVDLPDDWAIDGVESPDDGESPETGATLGDETTPGGGDASETHRLSTAVADVRTAIDFGVAVPDEAVDGLTNALDREDGRAVPRQDDRAWERHLDSAWYDAVRSHANATRYFHWPLEFPGVFAADGSASNETGFDAVVGNPPWVATAGRASISAAIDPDLRSYLERTFETATGQFDLFVAFTEQFVKLSRNGRVGIVLPDSILAREGNAPLRAFLLDHATPSRIVTLGSAFEDVRTGAILLVCGGDGAAVECVDATDRADGHHGERDGIGRADRSSPATASIPLSVFERAPATRFLVHLDEATRAVVRAVDTHPPLDRYATVSRGEEIGKRASFLHDAPSSETEAIVPGSAIVDYGIDAVDVRYVDPATVAKADRHYRSPKLLFRQTGDSLVGTYDDANRFTIKSAYNIHAKSASPVRETADAPAVLKHVLGVLNSPLLEWYHYYTHAAYRSVFPQINQSTFEAFPIAMADGPDARLVAAVDDRLDLTARRQQLNPDLAASLGAFEPGPTLGDRTECRPAPGVADTKLTATTESWPNLRIGTAVISRGDDATAVERSSDERPLELAATLRYKPDDARDTDRWGYAETDPIPALRIDGPDDAFRRLVETFVPYAVEAGEGTAAFRPAATKTISPLDRLRALRLPRLADVKEGLDAYERERRQVALLEERIADVDAHIAERVFDLYGLSKDERELVNRER